MMVPNNVLYNDKRRRPGTQVITWCDILAPDIPWRICTREDIPVQFLLYHDWSGLSGESDDSSYENLQIAWNIQYVSTGSLLGAPIDTVGVLMECLAYKPDWCGSNSVKDKHIEYGRLVCSPVLLMCLLLTFWEPWSYPSLREYGA